jgi:hypothetical protein
MLGLSSLLSQMNLQLCGLLAYFGELIIQFLIHICSEPLSTACNFLFEQADQFINLLRFRVKLIRQSLQVSHYLFQLLLLFSQFFSVEVLFGFLLQWWQLLKLL